MPSRHGVPIKRPTPLLLRQYLDAPEWARPSLPSGHGVPIKRLTPLLLLQHLDAPEWARPSLPSDRKSVV